MSDDLPGYDRPRRVCARCREPWPPDAWECAFCGTHIDDRPPVPQDPERPRLADASPLAVVDPMESFMTGSAWTLDSYDPDGAPWPEQVMDAWYAQLGDLPPGQGAQREREREREREPDPDALVPLEASAGMALWAFAFGLVLGLLIRTLLW